jgi:hypothetical protein
MRCKGCKKDMTANIVTSNSYADSEAIFPLVSLEVRGLEIERWEAREGFSVETESEDVFDDQDFTAGDWCEYAERMGTVVGVYDVVTSVRRS